MQRGFFTVMWSQFFSALADNALLVAALQLLEEEFATEDLKPLLKLCFAAAYVVLAPVVGAFADSLPKGQVMFLCNALKMAGCFLMLFGVDPLVSYTLVGIGAAAYSPAKYGIVTELLPPSQLVVANGWIEGLTVAATVFGAALGSVFISPAVAPRLAAIDVPFIEVAHDSPGQVAIGAISVLYFLAAAINAFVPRTQSELKPFELHPITRTREFLAANAKLWRDPLGRVSLTVTTLFWGAGGTLQVLAIQWSRHSLRMPLSTAGKMPAVVAFGVTLGAIYSARRLSLRDSVRVVPLGIAMGILCTVLSQVTDTWVAAALMVVVGVLSGFFVVPLNALLQHRGAALMGSGQSIAVQNFNENLSIVVMTGLTAVLLHYYTAAGVLAVANRGGAIADVALEGMQRNAVVAAMATLGVFVAGTMIVVEIMLRRLLAREPNLVEDDAGH